MSGLADEFMTRVEAARQHGLSRIIDVWNFIDIHADEIAAGLLAREIDSKPVIAAAIAAVEAGVAANKNQRDLADLCYDAALEAAKQQGHTGSALPHALMIQVKDACSPIAAAAWKPR